MIIMPARRSFHTGIGRTITPVEMSPPPKTYTSQYPTSHNDTYVKATSKFNTDYWPYFATDPGKSVTGPWGNASPIGFNNWVSASGSPTNQRFHIDLGSSKTIKRIYYENSHTSGSYTDSGAKAFILQGSDTNAGTFDDLVYANDGGWTDIQTGLQFDRHVDSNQADPKYIVITNTNAYRYYAFKISNNWGNASYMGLRRIVLQTED